MDTKNPQKILVSIIIPACNEELYIEATLRSIERQTYKDIETIVVVNGSSDKTYDISKKLTAKTLLYSEGFGPAKARNEGVKVAQGELYVFIDGDSTISPRAIEEIVHVYEKRNRCIGTIRALPIPPRFKSRIFFTFKNILHRTHWYRGVLALMFCDAITFERAKGFNSRKRVGEFKGFIARSLLSGAKYHFVQTSSVSTSTRRFEKHGYFLTLWFWIKWGILVLLGKRASTKEYKAIR